MPKKSAALVYMLANPAVIGDIIIGIIVRSYISFGEPDLPW